MITIKYDNIYIYIYTERERQRERDRDRETETETDRQIADRFEQTKLCYKKTEKNNPRYKICAQLNKKKKGTLKKSYDPLCRPY